MKKLFLISALLFSFNSWALSDFQPYDETADAHKDIANAIKLADESEKYVLLEMGGNWCPDCRTLGEYFARKDIKAWLDQRFIVVAVDVGEWNKNLDIAERYGNPISEGIPALVVLDKQVAETSLQQLKLQLQSIRILLLPFQMHRHLHSYQ